jgi:hypothetical protein
MDCMFRFYLLLSTLFELDKITEWLLFQVKKPCGKVVVPLMYYEGIFFNVTVLGAELSNLFHFYHFGGV